MCLPDRDGGFYEECGGHGRGAHSGGEEPPVSCLQECDWSSESLLEDNQQYRAEGREQGRRRETEDDPGIQANGTALTKLFMLPSRQMMCRFTATQICSTNVRLLAHINNRHKECTNSLNSGFKTIHNSSFLR